MNKEMVNEIIDLKLISLEMEDRHVDKIDAILIFLNLRDAPTKFEIAL